MKQLACEDALYFTGSTPGEAAFAVPACEDCAPQVRAEVEELCRGAPLVVRLREEPPRPPPASQS